MAIAHLSYVICDVCGAPASDPVEGAQSARFYANRAGFTSGPRPEYSRRGGRRWDFCPDHTNGSADA